MLNFKSVKYHITYTFTKAGLSPFRGRLEIEFNDQCERTQFLEGKLGPKEIKINNRIQVFKSSTPKDAIAEVLLPLTHQGDEILHKAQEDVIVWLKTNYPKGYHYELGIETIKHYPKMENVQELSAGLAFEESDPIDEITVGKETKPLNIVSESQPIIIPEPKPKPAAISSKSITSTNETQSSSIVLEPQSTIIPALEPKPATIPLKAPTSATIDSKPTHKNRLEILKKYIGIFLHPIQRLKFHIRLFAKMPSQYPGTMGVLSAFLILGGSLYFLSLTWPLAISGAIGSGLIVRFGTLLRNTKYEKLLSDIAAVNDSQIEAYNEGKAAGTGWFPYLKSFVKTSWKRAPKHYCAGLIEVILEERAKAETAWNEDNFKQNILK